MNSIESLYWPEFKFQQVYMEPVTARKNITLLDRGDYVTTVITSSTMTCSGGGRLFRLRRLNDKYVRNHANLWGGGWKHFPLEHFS